MKAIVICKYIFLPMLMFLPIVSGHLFKQFLCRQNSSKCDLDLRYDLPNGFTYLQLGREYINLFYLNIWHFKTIHRTTFLSFWIFYFINKIENFHFIYI